MHESIDELLLLLEVRLLGLVVQVWSGGIERGLAMALRFLNVVSASYAFVATTDPNRLAYALMQAGLPYRYGFMLVTALRFIPVFRHELDQVRNAQKAKGIKIQGLSISNFGRLLRYLVLPLIVTALAKVDSLTLSMEARGFGLYPDRSYRVDVKTSRADWLTLGVGLACMLCIYLPRPLVVGLPA